MLPLIIILRLFNITKIIIKITANIFKVDDM